VFAVVSEDETMTGAGPTVQAALLEHLVMIQFSEVNRMVAFATGARHIDEKLIHVGGTSPGSV
jgi:hypothetical protein